MTNKEEIFDIIQSHPEGLDDDDISGITGIRPRQQVQQLCNQLASTKRIRRESVNKIGKRRKVHNFPVDQEDGPALSQPEPEKWRRRLAALMAATDQSETEILDEALQLLAFKVLRTALPGESAAGPIDAADEGGLLAQND